MFVHKTSCAGGRHNMSPPLQSWPFTFWPWKWCASQKNFYFVFSKYFLSAIFVGCCDDVAQKWPGSSAAVDRCGRTRPIQCGRAMTSSWWLVEAGVRALQRPTCRAVTVQTAPTSTTRAPTVWPPTSVPVTTRRVIHWFHLEELSGVTAPSGESVSPSVRLLVFLLSYPPCFRWFRRTVLIQNSETITVRLPGSQNRREMASVTA